MPEMIVGRIASDLERVLFYPLNENGYHVIASHAQAANVELRDRIEYEEAGVNFGWFTRNLSPEKQLADLERAVIEAAIAWRANFDHAVADDYTEREALAQTVDALLIAAREKQ